MLSIEHCINTSKEFCVIDRSIANGEIALVVGRGSYWIRTPKLSSGIMDDRRVAATCWTGQRPVWGSTVVRATMGLACVKMSIVALDRAGFRTGASWRG